MITLFNFSHPYPDGEIERLGELLSETVTVVQVPVHLVESEHSTTDLIAAAVDDVGWAPELWQTQRYVVDPPGFSPLASVLVAELHGRSGNFPRIIRRARGEDGLFRVAEIIDLHDVREHARTRRF